MEKVLVITPTTGAPELIDCIRSVSEQSYSNTHHLIVTDGAKFTSRVDGCLVDGGVVGYGDKLFRCDLPFNTGGGGFYGHRIMAAFSHLVPDYEYVLFLDQDNWYDKNHVETLVRTIKDSNLDWAYSLRKIYNKDKNFIAEDNCESLGRWPIWFDPNGYLIDTSSYCFKTSFLQSVGHIWDHGWGADRRFYTIIKDHLKHDNYACSGEYTLNYRLGGNEGSVQEDFFIQGNKSTQSFYKGVLPWKKR
jgi:hypothetical protein